MADSSTTISDLARLLQVSQQRAQEIMAAVDQVRAGATFAGPMPSSILTDDPGDRDAVVSYSTLAADMPTLEPASAVSSGHSVNPDLSDSLDRYEDLGLLGRGGMGEVRRVRDRHFDRLLAMKVMRADRQMGTVATNLFLREARIEARLQHPGIPPVYDHGELPDGRPWYTMKEIRGEQLTDAIQTLHEATSEPNRFALLLRQLLRSFEAVCSTVAYAHEQGVVHRDIKPANIMLGSFGEVLVVDWGLATTFPRPAGRRDASLQVVGTPSYMSPEQARGEGTSIAPSTDVYALGATLYHIVSGQPPYHGGSSSEILEMVVNHHAVAPIQLGAAGSILRPDALIELCERAMHPQLSERLPSASAMAEAIQDWLDSAERDERGRKELVRARGLEYAGRVERARAVELWQEAAVSVEQRGAAQARGWARWLVARTAFQKAKRLREQQLQALEASLAHSPMLRDAHEQLARAYSVIALKARERGAIDAARGAWARVLEHLDALPAEDGAALREALEAHRRNPLQVDRARRGALIGRGSLCEALVNQHAQGESLLTLHGEPGVGKSALLVEHGLWLMGGEYAPVYVNLQNLSDTASIEQSVTRAIEAAVGSPQPAQTIPALIGERAVVLLLDNIDQCTSIVADLVQRWLDECASLRVVCTSRTPLPADKSIKVQVPRLQRLAAVELLIRHALRADPDLDPDSLERDDLLGLVERLDGIPLALELAAARMSTFRLRELRVRLDERLDLLGASGLRRGGLDAAMAISWDSLSATARLALAQASLFRAGFDRMAAEQVFQLTGGESSVVNALEELVRHNLLRVSRSDHDQTRYLLSGPIWSWANAQLERACSVQDRRELAVRHARFFATMYARGGAANRSLSSLAEELENFVVAARRGPPEESVRCTSLACEVFTTKGPIVRGIELLEYLLERTDFRKSQRRALLILLGRCLRNAGRMDDARQRLNEAHGLGDAQATTTSGQATDSGDARAAIAEALTGGAVAVDEHRYEDARVLYRRALLAAQRLNEVSDQARAHAGLSMLPPLADRSDHTREHFELAVELARSVGDDHLALKTVGNYGLALFRRERLDEALACFAEAETGHRSLGSHHAAAVFSMNQGILLQRLGRLSASDHAFDRALEACDLGGDLRVRASVLGSKASLALYRGRYAQAFRLANEALEWQQNNGDRGMVRRTQRLLLGICIDTGQRSQAEQLLRALEPKPGEVLEPSERLSTEINRGVFLLCTKGREADACACFEAVAGEAEALGLKHVQVLAMLNLAEALEQVGNHASSADRFEAALSTSREAFPALSGVAMGGLAVCAARAGEHKRARGLLREAGDLVGNWTLERLRWLMRAGLVAAHRGDDLESLRCLREVRESMRALGIGAQSPVQHLFGLLNAALRDRRTNLSATIERTPAGADAEKMLVLSGLAELALLEQEACQFDESEALLDRAEHLARAIGNDDAIAQVVHQRLNIARERGRYDEARANGAAALEHTRRAGNLELEVRIRTNLGIVAGECGEYDEAMEHLDEAGRIATDLGDVRGQVLIASNLANLDLSRGQYARAEEGFRLAGRNFEGIGLDRYAMLCVGNRGDALLRMGQLDLAGELLERAVEQARQHAHQHAEFAFLGSLAEVRARQGRLDDANRYIDQGMSLACDTPVERACFLGKASIVALLSGQRERAHVHVMHAKQTVAGAQLPPGNVARTLLRVVEHILEADGVEAPGTT